MTPTDPTPLGAGFTDQSISPTPVSEWKRATEVAPPPDQVGFMTELPSGNFIRMTRRMDLAFLLKTGQIPNPLAGIVQGMIDANTTRFPDDISADSLMQLLDLMNETAVSAILDPQFDMPEKRQKGESAEQYMERLATWQPEEGKLSVWDLTSDDRNFVFAVAQGQAADLARFREESERALEALQDVKRSPKPTKRTSRAKSKR